ncbi:MAG TPA: DUF302 domain-containing protein [Methylomirabilota bacterium]|nr:DUF302 domain-containing protein [Methylomirabilota bacterium]
MGQFVTYLRVFAFAVVLLLASAVSARAAEGLITKPSAYPVSETLDRLEAALKERGFIIFTRLDHAAAGESFGLKMPKSTVLVFGNPRLGTPVFIKHPTLAIDLPLKALVWEDASSKVFLSYNSAQYLGSIYGRHGAPTNPEATTRLEGLLTAATDAAVK